MEKQTENYIVLKPIAERFNMVAKEISDDDIKHIIKEAMKEQIQGIFNFGKLEDLTNDYIDENQDDIKQMIAESINSRLRFK